MKKTLLLFATLPAALLMHAQTIPNAGFETWVSNSESPHTYQVPQSWITIDAYLTAFQNAFGNSTYVVNSVAQVGSAHGGSSAVQMSVVQSNQGDTVAGTIFSTPSAISMINTVFTGNPAMGFPYATRSANLTGFYKFSRVGNDSAAFALVFTKWNTVTSMRDTVAKISSFYITSAAAGWTAFTAPITYLTGETPDTALIGAGISSNVPHPGTVFTIDDLGFSGTVAGIEEHHENTAAVAVFPNPFNDEATMRISNVKIDRATVEIYDMLGNKVKTMGDITSDTFTISREGLADGLYFYNIINGNAVVASGKISVQ